jgi:hypothetical protein
MVGDFKTIMALSVMASTMILGQPAIAANISLSDDPMCTLILQGEIVSGDVDRFTEIASKTFPEHVAESTAQNTVCLDSPGGSYIEGVLLAELFYEQGIGTVIGPNHTCYSACALAFMMGMAKGDEVSFINRTLHVGGELGFHRPYLQLPPDATTSVAEVEFTYDAAISSVVAYLALANKSAPWSSKPIVAADLIERIFSYRGQDFFMIDRVERALRWDIAIEGVEFEVQPSFEAAYYACENLLQWEVGVHEEQPNYLRQHLARSWATEPWVRYSGQAQDGFARFDVTGRKSGYASASCVVEFGNGGLRVCGNDEYTGVILGGAQCPGDFRWSNALAVLPPHTRLSNISGYEYPAGVPAKCMVFSGGVATDDEDCLATYRVIQGDTGPEAQRLFLWPSGSTTLVSQQDDEFRINSQSATTKWREGFEMCATNSATGNEFCFSIEN